MSAENIRRSSDIRKKVLNYQMFSDIVAKMAQVKWLNDNVKQKTNLFFIGDWQVTPASNSLRCNGTIKQLEPKAMDVLILLCQHPEQVLSADEIVSQCWGNGEIGDNPVHKAINQLRKAFDDKPSTPNYIETIRKRGYRIVAKVNFPLNDELKAQQSTWQGDSPFPGLSAFEPNDAQVFFGRNQQIATLLERISTQVAYGRAFCLILGSSGSGKSSLINAGVLPRLLNRNGYDGIGVVSHTSLDFADVSQTRLFIDLASALLDWECDEQPIFIGLSAESLAEQLHSNCSAVIELCKRALSDATTNFARPHFFIFIDRLEVLLSSPFFSADERSLFLGVIEALATSGCIMVFSACRNDFYPQVVNQSVLMSGKANGAHFDLIRPHRSELMQMIRLPAVAANLSWSQDPQSATPLDEILCTEAASNPDSLPMLQYTLQELYLQRSDNNELLYSVYQDLGGIEGAIGKKAEEVYQQLPPEHQSHLAHVLSLLVTLNPDGETITSRAARWSQLNKKSETAFVQAMVDSRLFVSHLQNNEPCFSLAHEALLRRWARASDWITAHQDSLAIKSRLQQLTERWLREGKNSAYLLAKGKPLQEAQSLKDNAIFDLNASEQALITASLKRLKVIHWLRRVTFTLLCMLTVIAVLMSVKSQQAEALAQQKRLEAESLLGFMVGEFADKLRSVKRMDLLDGISNKALEYFSSKDNQQAEQSFFSLSDPSLNFKARFQHAQTLGAMGEVAYSRAKTDEAVQAFATAKVILDTLHMEQPDNLELLKTLGANAFWLGQLAYDKSDFAVAQPLFELYRDYSEQMNLLAPDNVDGWVEAYYSYSTLGSLYLKQQNYSAAKLAFESSLTLNNNALVQRPHDSTLRSDKADTLSWLATTEQHLGHLSTTLNLHQLGQEELETALKSTPNNAYFLQRIAYSYWHQAKIYDLVGQSSNSHAKMLRAITILKNALQQDPNNEIWNEDLIALQIFKLRLDINTKTSSLPPDMDKTIQKILSKNNYPPNIPIDAIKYYLKSGAHKKAKELLTITRSTLSPLSNDAKQLLALAELNLLDAQILMTESRQEQALKYCEQSIKLLTSLNHKSKNIEYILPYVKAHDCLDKLGEIPQYTQSLKEMSINNYHFNQ